VCSLEIFVYVLSPFPAPFLFFFILVTVDSTAMRVFTGIIRMCIKNVDDSVFCFEFFVDIFYNFLFPVTSRNKNNLFFIFSLFCFELDEKNRNSFLFFSFCFEFDVKNGTRSIHLYPHFDKRKDKLFCIQNNILKLHFFDVIYHDSLFYINLWIS